MDFQESGREASGVSETRHSRSADDRRDRQFGRRVEADRSWTVYHVFTGVPADGGSAAMTGLSRADATDMMMSLNRRATRRQADLAVPRSPAVQLRWIGGDPT